MYLIILEFIFKLLLACGLVYGGLYFVIVYQKNSNSPKVFKVTDKKRTRTVLLPYISLESFTKKCRAKFNLGNNETLVFASGEDEEMEVDEEYLDHLADKSLIIVKGERETSGHNDDDGDNDDYLGGDVQNRFVRSENASVWKSKPINIAVTGESGKGKSSFINAFRSASPGQKDAAKIGEEECTRKCRAFRHYKYDSFVLWDVPGVGTNNFPKEKYLNAIQIDRFDFFMIISSTRFSELDSWLVKEILKRNKSFYFIRTKIDIDMSNKKRRFRKLGQHFCEKVEFEKMKSELYQKLYLDFQIQKLHFFMISNHHPNKYDFPLILNQLLQDVKIEIKMGLDSLPYNTSSFKRKYQH